ncbi:hypothetical protein [Nitrosomonas sp. Is37]|nr:hypothetical protein [Nitrosomonas sp. Is37]MDV6345108.1 hypothetical protein [Nitrosomonas sp. Is37]
MATNSRICNRLAERGVAKTATDKTFRRAVCSIQAQVLARVL